MTLELLDTIVLTRDLPEHALERGDVGAVVELYEPDGVEVEFVSADGRTVAVVTLARSDVRHVGGTDMLAVRPLDVA